MRIVSEFHDYYDSIQAMGQDQTLVYVRKPVSEDLRDKYPFPRVRRWRASRTVASRVELDVDNYTVGFCGRIYPVLRITRDRYSSWNKPQSLVCFTMEEVDQFMTSLFKPEYVEAYQGKGHPRILDRMWPRWCRQEEFAKLFRWYEGNQDKYAEWFLKHHCPVFVAKSTGFEDEIVWNGCLKDVEFFRVFDTFKAFQEIAMYYGGLAAPQKPIPVVPDKVLAGAKGFDKWSFRKEPKGKKRK